MAKRRTAVKRQRADKKRRLHNLKIKQGLKKTLKKFQELLAQKNTVEAKTFLRKVFSQLDKAAKKNILHQNTADRKKSRLQKQLLATSSS